MMKQAAFTLIELLIVVAIVGILAGIAYPSYQNSLKKSRRADAQGALIGFANVMERFFTENNTYCDTGTSGGANTCGASGTDDTGTPPATLYQSTTPSSGTAYYNLTINAVGASTYTLQATPVSGGPQDGDGNLQITNTGIRRWDRNNDGDYLDTDETSWN